MNKLWCLLWTRKAYCVLQVLARAFFATNISRVVRKTNTMRVWDTGRYKHTGTTQQHFSEEQEGERELLKARGH